jgi:hypothetical protein
MRYQPNDDQPMDAVLLELQIQVCVGETARAPMFLYDDFARRRHEFGTELAPVPFMMSDERPGW